MYGKRNEIGIIQNTHISQHGHMAFYLFYWKHSIKI